MYLTPVEHALVKSLILGYNLKESAARVGRMLGIPMSVSIAHDKLRNARHRGDYTTLIQLVAATACATEVLPPNPVPRGRPMGGKLTEYSTDFQRRTAERRRGV